MTQEKTEPVVEKKKRRKARTLEEREADAQKALEDVKVLRTAELHKKHNDAIETLYSLRDLASKYKRPDLAKAVDELSLELKAIEV